MMLLLCHYRLYARAADYDNIDIYAIDISSTIFTAIDIFLVDDAITPTAIAIR